MEISRPPPPVGNPGQHPADLDGNDSDAESEKDPVKFLCMRRRREAAQIDFLPIPKPQPIQSV